MYRLSTSRSGATFSLYNGLFVSVFIQRGVVLNPVTFLQIAIPAQKLHITCCTCSAFAVRNDVIELEVGARAADTTLDTPSLIALPDSNTHILWDMTAISVSV